MSDPGEAIPLRVLIVEDHPMVTEGLSSLLQDYPDLTIVGSAASVADVVAMTGEISPDVAVIDFHLPDGTGADVADHIRTRSPSTAIVFFSVDGSDGRLLAAIEAGASNYLLKSATGTEIINAIRSAARGETLIPAETITGVLTRERQSARQHARHAEALGRLTTREQEILALMIQGADNRTVAERLGIRYATVRTHVRSILDKLGAHSQLEAVAKATQWGFRARCLPFLSEVAAGWVAAGDIGVHGLAVSYLTSTPIGAHKAESHVRRFQPWLLLCSDSHRTKDQRAPAQPTHE
jgi:two-component system, NarL family, response regulator DevR